MQQMRPEQNRPFWRHGRPVSGQTDAARAEDTPAHGLLAHAGEDQPQTHRTGQRHATGFRMGVALTAGVLVLAGCRHQDAIDSTLEWTQNMRGGVISQQRPPPPGRYDPYPHVGLTPTQAPALPSAQARAMLTERLIRDRNLTYRTVAANGTLTPDIPPPPNAAAAQSAAGKGNADKGAGTSAAGGGANAAKDKAAAGQQAASLPPDAAGAIMDAAEAPPQQPTTPSPLAKPAPSKPAAKDTKKNAAADAEADTPEVAMPEVKNGAQKPPTPESAIPQIPEGPPAPPSFPGFDVPSDAHLPDGVQPNYDLSDAKGTALHFMPQSDQLSAGQESTLAKLVQKTPHGPFFVRGFGNSPSLSPQDQADAVQLGLLRAQRVAQELIKLNAPSDAIHIRGDAFGTGARIANSP